MTRSFKSVEQIVQVLVAFTCDCCKVEYNCDDIVEYQEHLSLDFMVGYGGILGDGNRIECDLCQRCMEKVLGPYLRVVETDVIW